MLPYKCEIHTHLKTKFTPKGVNPGDSHGANTLYPLSPPRPTPKDTRYTLYQAQTAARQSQRRKETS